MCNMPTEGIKIEKYFRKNLGQYFMDGFGSDGSVVKWLIGAWCLLCLDQIADKPENSCVIQRINS